MNTATSTILGLLSEDGGVWSIEELAREIGELPAAIDAVDELACAGLANRINKRFVCASRATLLAEQLATEGA